VVHSNNDSGQKFQLVVNTELEALVPVLQWFEEMSQSRLPDSIIWQVKVALAEGFTNTVRYAHDDLPSTTPIQIELVFLTDNLTISIWNFGQPFDLEKKLEEINQSPTPPLEKESERGLLFMKALTDNLQYLRLEDGRNCLVLSKNIERRS
jgi:serine/threonine-protein kinase RsbW